MDYPYENLGPERFQQFCQALLTKEHPRLQCFPIGQPDGGRDAVRHYASSDSDFAVYQVKFARRPQAETDPHKWLLEVITKEAPKIRGLIPRGASAYFLITNVSGTAHPDAGAIDKMNQLLTSEAGVPSLCYWRDDLNRRLDVNWDLKWVYPELMTGPDLIRAIIESGLSDQQQRRADAIRRFVRDQYESDKQVRFKQVELQNNLLDLFIDVPISREHLNTRKQQVFYGSLVRAVAAGTITVGSTQENGDSSEDQVVEAEFDSGDQVLGAATILLHRMTQQQMHHLVLEGAPGQGKSTLVQYVCQIHRMRTLGRSDDLAAIPSEHRSGPVRLPFKVDLRDLSTWLNRKDPFSPEEADEAPALWFKSLESFLAAQVRHHSGGAEFSQDDLVAVARVSAILIVFDGLDEVADIRRRQEVVEEILKGVNRLEECTASLQVVVTSRPAAFANSPGLPEELFPYFQLDSVTRPLINDYADKWLRARRVDSRQSAEFKRILRDKLDQPHLRDLARNPMQLAILLSLIHTRGSSLPDKRTALYDSYIELFFNRESEKSEIVREHRDLLVDIHRYLAWVLHSEAEQGHNRGSVSSDRLLGLVSNYLVGEGHDVKLATQLFAGMVERVVALVSRVQGTYEFEVQPLREYFAARFLYDTAPYSPPGNERRGTKPDRFDAISRDFYWLNVARFYAGCYSKGELPSLLDGIQELSKDVGYRFTSHPRILAATLLSDWVFSQHPKSVRDVVGLILDGLGLRFVLSSGRRRMASTSPLVLPPKCGRDELIQRCFSILRAQPPRDYALDVIDLIKANSDAREIEGLWTVEVSAAKGEARTKWLEYGLLLELLPNTEMQKLIEILNAEMVDRRVLGLLLRARRFDVILKDKSNLDTLVMMALDRELGPAAPRGDSVLDLFIHSIDAVRYSEAFRTRYPIPLYQVWHESEHYNFTSLRKSDLSQLPDSEHLQRCIEVVKVANVASESLASEWASKIGPWTTVVERARTTWGDHWALFHLANVASGIRSPTETCKEFADLLDHSKPLCHRARYARLRAGSPAWWKQQLEATQSELDKMFTSLVALRWGSTATLVDLSEMLSAVLESLSPDGWSRLAMSLRQSLFLSHEPRDEAYISIDPSALPSNLPPRLATAIGIRAKPGTRVQIIDRFLADYAGSDLVVLEFCQREGIDLRRLDANRWPAYLELIRKSYARGVVSEPFAFQQMIRRGADSKTLPLSIAEEVAANADKYPGYLVGLAEMRCRAAVASNITAVGHIAARDAWFELDPSEQEPKLSSPGLPKRAPNSIK